MMRLNQFIAHAGICSRRKAEVLIASGAIKVNGVTAGEPSIRIKEGDVVLYKGKRLVEEKKIYWLLNKPFNCITTLDDPQNRKTVKDCLPGQSGGSRVYPVGRLDRNTTGVLLLTNDGYLSKGLAHPSSEVNKTYEVRLKKRLSHQDLAAIRRGVVLEDGVAEVDDILPKDSSKMIFVMHLHSGKNRIIRRIFAKLSYSILSLERISYGGISLADLPRGKARPLTQKEIASLYDQVVGRGFKVK